MLGNQCPELIQICSSSLRNSIIMENSLVLTKQCRTPIAGYRLLVKVLGTFSLSDRYTTILQGQRTHSHENSKRTDKHSVLTSSSSIQVVSIFSTDAILAFKTKKIELILRLHSLNKLNSRMSFPLLIVLI